MPTMLVSMSFELITCCSCKVLFAVTDDHLNKLRQNGSRFYCPNGHPQSYTSSEVNDLKLQIAGLRSENKKLKDAKVAAEKAAKLLEDKNKELPPYSGIPRTEYEWSADDKKKLISTKAENPKDSWQTIGAKIGKTGNQASSMWHNMKNRGELEQALREVNQGAEVGNG